MYLKAKELAEENGWFLARQFETDANADIHESTTAARDPRRLQGRAARLFRHRLRHRRHGRGRRAGAARRAGPRRRSSSASRRTPSSSARGIAAGAQRRRRARPASHPAFEPHPIQGWTPDFIPLVLQEAIDGHYYDELIPIAGPEGIEVGARARREGGHLHRRLRRLDLRRRDAGRRDGARRAR